MRTEINVLLAALGRVDVDAVRRAFAAEPDLVLAALIDGDAAWAERFDVPADALVVACAQPSPEVLDIVRQEAAVRPEMPIVVMCAHSPSGRLPVLFDAGAGDVVVAADMSAAGPQLAFAIEKARTRKASVARVQPAAAGGQLISVLGPKGGTGKTVTASNLAVALSAEGKQVALVDLDLEFGDLGLVMGIEPERTIFDLATAGGTLDAQKLDAFLVRHSSGVRVLLAPTRPDHASAVGADFLRELYEVLCRQYDFVVVDTPPGFTSEVIATIDASAGVCLIGTLDTPSLKNAKLGAETLELMTYPHERVRLVLNRADSSVGVSHADVVAVLGRAPDVLIPSTRQIVRSVNAGEPIALAAPRSEAAKSFRALATLFLAPAPSPAPAPSRPRRGLRSLARA